MVLATVRRAAHWVCVGFLLDPGLLGEQHIGWEFLSDPGLAIDHTEIPVFTERSFIKQGGKSPSGCFLKVEKQSQMALEV